MRKQLINFVAALAILVVIFGTMYAVVQQSQRRDANYPQVQMAEDTAAQLKGGVDPYVASTLSPVDMQASLAPFTIVYDFKGNVVSGSGYLDKKVPKAPLGLLEASKGTTYHAVTWEPKGGVRIAAVVVPAQVTSKKTTKTYYVLSGRSLTEVEKNENKTLLITVVGGVLSLLIAAGAFYAKQLSSIRL